MQYILSESVQIFSNKITRSLRHILWYNWIFLLRTKDNCTAQKKLVSKKFHKYGYSYQQRYHQCYKYSVQVFRVWTYINACRFILSWDRSRDEEVPEEQSSWLSRFCWRRYCWDEKWGFRLLISKTLNQRTHFINSRRCSRAVKFVRGSHKLHIMKSHAEQNFREITFLKKTFRCVMPDQLRTANRGISQAMKTEILQKLCPLMPETRWRFWEDISVGEHNDDGEI